MRLRHVILPAFLLALAAPGGALAQTPSGGAQAAEPAPAYASASDGSVSIRTRPAGMLGMRKVLTGTLPTSGAGRTVTVERFDDLTGDWSPIAHGKARETGTFRARFKPDRTGAQRLRARVDGGGANLSSAAPELDILVYRRVTATWYGPGFYGNKTACGQKLTRTLEGVAHKTLKCGREVQIYFKGRTATVPVVDRGPFANGASYDLTAATAEALGVESTVKLGALAQTSR